MSWNVAATLSALAKERPVFHSEADFQHALGWKVRTLYPKARIRLEVPKRLEYHRKRWPAHVDLTVELGATKTWIELKHNTDALRVNVNGEYFALQKQTDVAGVRFGFWQDVQRLEQICWANSPWRDRGVAIFLTNFEALWTNKNRGTKMAKDQAYRLEDGRRYHGRLWWPSYRDGRKMQPPSSLTLRGSYRSSWREYSKLAGDGPTRFRYFAITVCGQ